MFATALDLCSVAVRVAREAMTPPWFYCSQATPTCVNREIWSSKCVDAHLVYTMCMLGTQCVCYRLQYCRSNIYSHNCIYCIYICHISRLATARWFGLEAINLHCARFFAASKMRNRTYCLAPLFLVPVLVKLQNLHDKHVPAGKYHRITEKNKKGNASFEN